MRLFRDQGDNRVERMALDPQFLFRVGRLLGATEMVGHVLASSDIEANQRLGAILLDRLAWFPSDGSAAGTELADMLRAKTRGPFDRERETSEAPTEIRSPRDPAKQH